MTIPTKPKRGDYKNQTVYARELRQWHEIFTPDYKAKKAAAMREYRKNNSEKMKEADQRKYLKNADRIKQKQKDKWHSDVELSRKNLREYTLSNLPQVMLQSIKSRCVKENITFDLDLDYLISIWPKDHTCPVFGCKLTRNKRGESRDTSASADRIIPEKGYVKGNVAIVSFKANRMKNNGTVEDLRKVLHFYENHTNFL